MTNDPCSYNKSHKEHIMKASYDKNECGYKCMVEYKQRDALGSQMYRGVSFQRHPTKKLAKEDAMKSIERVMF